MRVAILGGYGVFGTLMAELLVRDGHQVAIAGRNWTKAEKTARALKAEALRVDRAGDLDDLFAFAPDVVVDAAGPFQAYHSDAHRLPRACCERGVHYLDLSDASDFTAGIGALDDLAKAGACWVLSGASSVPGLSSVVVQALAEGGGEIQLIDTAILPGNRAQRGFSVIESIVQGVGRPMRVWRGGKWREQRGWTDRRRYRLAPGITRSAYTVDVPDLHLFPLFFRARSVTFRAGMELDVMNNALGFLAGLRKLWRLTLPNWALHLLHWLSRLLYPFGTDRGGMLVTVVQNRNGEARSRTWQLLVEAGDGPYVPTLVARALIRKAATVPSGARPCLAEVSLAEFEEAAMDLSITTDIAESPRPTLFQSALADRWALLPKQVQELHSVQDVGSFSGLAEVTRGRSLIARLAAWFFRFPKAGTRVPLTITKTRTEKGEIWERNFDGQVFRSCCTPSPVPHRYRERFWCFNYEQDLPVVDGAMFLPVRRGWFLGIPLPKLCLPGSDSREYVRDGVFHFDVGLSAPLGGGLIVRYRGSLTADTDHEDC